MNLDLNPFIKVEGALTILRVVAVQGMVSPEVGSGVIKERTGHSKESPNFSMRSPETLASVSNKPKCRALNMAAE